MEIQSGSQNFTSKKWYRRIGIITIAILVIIVAGVLHFYFKKVKKTSPRSYVVPGRVVISFNKNLSIDEINSFLQKNNLQTVDPLSETTKLSPTLYGKAPGEAEQKLTADLKKLQSKGIIVSCQWIRTVKGTENADASCYLNTKISLQNFDNSVKQYPEIHMFPGIEALSTVTVKVPEGQENTWIKKLSLLSEIQYAVYADLPHF